MPGIHPKALINPLVIIIPVPVLILNPDLAKPSQVHILNGMCVGVCLVSIQGTLINQLVIIIPFSLFILNLDLT